MKPRQFHIFDFPDKIYVLLKDQYRKYLFDQAIAKLGSREESSIFLGVGKSTSNLWYSGRRFDKNGKQISLACPLWALKKLFSKIPYDINLLYENIILLRSGHSTIYKPKLPLFESTKLYSLLGNLLGDSYISEKNDSPNYSNKRKELAIEFKKKLEILGKVDFKETVSGRHYRFPKIVVDIIKHLYQLRHGTFNASLPKELWELPREYAAATIGAIVDDDGSIADDKIEIYSASRKLLEDIRSLLNIKFPEIEFGSIIPKRDNYFFFQIYSKSFLQFKHLIHLTHSEKIKNLDFNIKRREIRKTGITLGKGTTKSLILEFLSNENLTTKELSRNLFISMGTVNSHLNQLEKQGKVKSIRIDRGYRNICRLWSKVY